MKVTTLGTGWPLPDAARAGASNLVEAGGQRFLVDTGRGVLMRLAAAGSGMGQVTAVFLTHLHSDHVNDFNDVVTTSWIGQFTPGVLKVIGPTGTQRFVDATLAMLEDDICWRLDHHADLTWRPEVEVTEVTDGVAFEADGVRVLAAPTEHKPVPCDGLDRLCAGADVYVQTVCRRSAVEAIPSPRLQDILDYHSDLVQVGQTAARGGVGTVVLTHLIPPPAPGTEAEWAAEVAEHFAGTIVVADDLTVVEAPLRGD